MRYFLVDKVTELTPGHRARGVKGVTLTDEVLHDHFPDYPIMPGSLILEGTAQLAGFLIEMSVNTEGRPPRRAVLMQVDQAKFYQTAGPGDQLSLTATIESLKGSAARVTTQAALGDRRVMRASLTFVLRVIDCESVHVQRRKLYRLWTRHFETPPAIV